MHCHPSIYTRTHTSYSSGIIYQLYDCWPKVDVMPCYAMGFISSSFVCQYTIAWVIHPQLSFYRISIIVVFFGWFNFNFHSVICFSVSLHKELFIQNTRCCCLCNTLWHHFLLFVTLVSSSLETGRCSNGKENINAHDECRSNRKRICEQ